jgi:adenylate cyclase
VKETARRWHRPRFTLRFTLVSLIVVLLLSTVLAIGTVAFGNTRQGLRELAEAHFAVIVGAVGRAERVQLTTAVATLEELRVLAGRGLLPVDDADALGVYLVERLRYLRGLDWISYSEAASGRFTGAWRREDGAVVLNQSAPDRDGGRPTEVVVGADGTRTPFARDVGDGYDPRERDWYRRAVASDEVVWSDPFVFNEGRAGFTAALALRDPASGLARGVFTTDFFLDEVSRYLANIPIGHSGRAYVLTPDGQVLVSSLGVGGGVDPLLAAALAALPQPLGNLAPDQIVNATFHQADTTYVGALQLSRVDGGLTWITAIVVPEREFLGVAEDNFRLTLAFAAVALVVAMILGYLLANRVAGPLRAIARDLERVGRFELSPEPVPSSFVHETAVVSGATERMKASLRSFARYVPTDLVRELLAHGEEARLGGRTRCLTLYFSDIQGFTSISERLRPMEVVAYLAEYLAEMTALIDAYEGTVDKFMGDGILAFFNAPRDVPDHAAQACRSALRAQERLAALGPRWTAEGKTAFHARIGLHTGEVVVGNIGTPERFAYTVIGDAVNLASRLESLSKVYGTSILGSDELRAAAGAGFEWRCLDRVAVVGRTEGTLVGELLGETGTVLADVLAARDQYEAALAAYFARRFADAAVGFRAAAAARPGDKAAPLMALRADDLAHDPPPAEWDGIHVQTSK